MNISLTCPICRRDTDPDDRLDIDVTLVQDTQGEPPYTAPMTTLDEYNILWEQSGHGKCERWWQFAYAISNTPANAPSSEIHMLRAEARRLTDAFEDAIFSAAIDAEADYGT